MDDKSEDRIRKAIEEGHFENLSGKGKPLNLDENPFEDPEWRAAHHLLREGGFSLPWIEARKEIEAQLEDSRRQLGRAWARRLAALEQGLSLELVQLEWAGAVDVFRKKVEVLNREIRDYNLQTPLLQFQMLHLKADREIEKITSQDSPSGTI
jgi:hypothetical protein